MHTQTLVVTEGTQYKLLSVLGVKPRPSESVTSTTRGGFGGLTDSGEVCLSEAGADGDCPENPCKCEKCNICLNVHVSPKSPRLIGNRGRETRC